jgi:hypothetical protein
MTTFPQVGDAAVDLRKTKGGRNLCGEVVTVKDITTTLVITSDGERYNRARLHPASEGRYSDRELVPATDPRVLVVKSHEHLDAVAQLAVNLSRLDYRRPEDVVASLAQILGAAHMSWREVIALMREASRAEQESAR